MNEDDEVAAWIQAELDKEESIRKEGALRGARGEINAKVADSISASTSLDGILAERHKTHGDYTHQADVCQRLKRIIHSNTGLNKNPLTATQLDALEMIAMKMSRIVTGDPSHKDSWLDIAGYATLVANRIYK